MKLSVSMTKKQVLLGSVLLLMHIWLIPFLLQSLKRSVGLWAPIIVQNVLVFAFNLVFIILIFHRFLLDNFKNAFHRPGRLFSSFGLGMAFYGCGNVAVNILLMLVHPDFQNINDQAISQMSQGWWWLALLGTVVFVPTAEEVLYRGVLFCPLQKKSRVLAYIVSTVTFSMIHLLNYIGTADPLTLLLCFLQYLPAGFALAFAYERADSIAAPILMHTLLNFTSMLTMR